MHKNAIARIYDDAVLTHGVWQSTLSFCKIDCYELLTIEQKFQAISFFTKEKETGSTQFPFWTTKNVNFIVCCSEVKWHQKKSPKNPTNKQKILFQNYKKM